MQTRSIGLLAVAPIALWLASCVGDEPAAATSADAGSDSALISDGQSSGDGATDASCSTCANGDGCCAPGCNAVNDDDCQPVCGNHVTEPGEVCDDGNTDNGDACDPTCQFGNNVTILSGTPGQQASADDTGAFARLNNLAAITSDGTSNLYLADSYDQTIKQVTTSGVVTTIAGAHKINASTDGTGAAARFSNPAGIVYLGGALYVSEAAALRKITLPGAVVTTVASPPIDIFGKQLRTDGTNIIYPSSGAVAGYNPTSTATSTIVSKANIDAVDGVTGGAAAVSYNASATKVLVGTSGNVLSCTPGGTCAVVAGTSGMPGCVATNISTGGKTQYVSDMVASGAIYLVDGCNAVRSASGNLITYAGTLSSSGGGYADGANASALFSFPIGITAISSFLYVTEVYNAGVVRRVTSTTTSTLAGAVAYSGSTITFGATGATSSYPVGSGAQKITAIAADDSYVYATFGFGPSDLFKVSLANGGATDIGTWSTPSYPGTMVLVGSNLLGAFTDGTIGMISTTGANPQTYAGTAGNKTPATDGPRLTTAILWPLFVATDGTNVYFVDNDKQIRMVDASDDMVKTIAGAPGSSDVLDETGTAAHFKSIFGIAYAAGSLFVADDAGGVIRQIDIATKKVTTIAGTVGMRGAVDAVGTAARFAGVRALASDGTSLFLLDTNGGYGPPYGTGDLNGSTIRQLELATGRVTTMIGTRAQWTIKGGVGTAARVSFPNVATFNAKARLITYDPYEGVFQRIE